MSDTVSFRQVNSLAFPSGDSKSVGWIRLSPEALSQRTGVRFTAGVDDLDPFVQAGLRLASGRQAFLLHRRVSDYGIDVYADVSDDGPRTMRELMAALGLSAEERTVFDHSGEARQI